jgi:hypothetical protein
MDYMVIWKDIPVLYRAKEIHIKKIGGKLYRALCRSFGEVPVGNFNETTGKFEACENARRLAYGARKRLCYRRKKGALS